MLIVCSTDFNALIKKQVLIIFVRRRPMYVGCMFTKKCFDGIFRLKNNNKAKILCNQNPPLERLMHTVIYVSSNLTFIAILIFSLSLCLVLENGILYWDGIDVFDR